MAGLGMGIGLNRFLTEEPPHEPIIVEPTAWYGIEIDESNSSPDVTRIASEMILHSVLPVHDKLKACLLNDNGTVNYYLQSDDWSKQEDGTPSILDGTDGQVMIEWPTFYFKVEQDTPEPGKHQLKISEHALTGFTWVRQHFVSAFESSIDRVNLKLASVVNTSENYRGGNNTSAWDAESNTLLGKPVSDINRTNFRTYARNRGAGWNINSHTDHQWLYWFFVIEYATLNSQKAVNSELDGDGFKQGGLGNGVTTAINAKWTAFNANNPFIDNGSSNSLANYSGEVDVTVTDFGGSGIDTSFKVPRYRGHENPYGHIWNILDGVSVLVKSVASGGTSDLWISDSPGDWNDLNQGGSSSYGEVARVNGYTKKVLVNEGGSAGFAPKLTTGGSAISYYCDYFYTSVPPSGESLKMVMVGGRATGLQEAGLGCFYCFDATSFNHQTIGTRLSYR